MFIVIPAYNEGGRIEKTVRDYAGYFGGRAEILVVLNGCRDRTGEIVKKLASEFHNVAYLEFSEAIGKGGAVQEGFRHILVRELGMRNEELGLIGFVDADEATKPEEYDRLSKLMGDASGVIGSRFLKDSVVTGRSLVRSVVGHAFHWIVRILFHLPYADTQCGVKIFQQEALRQILPELRIHGMAFDVEMLVVARRHGLRIKEAATVWEGKPNSGSLGSSVSIVKSGWKMFWSLVELRGRNYS
ncbi:MAG TPA: glycosyltransferase [Patescibacteria group bacterium]|nr:glycosyltransferase [Patescibacteria group bacterium]